MWAFLLLGEELERGQFVGIAIVIGGLLAFIVLNERGEPAHGRPSRSGGDRPRGRRSRRDVTELESGDLPHRVGVGPVELGDEVRRGVHASIGRFAELAARSRESPASAAMRASASRAKTSTWASSLRRASSRIATRRSSAPGRPSSASIAASRHSPSAACSPPPAARCHAVAASSAVSRSCALPERTEHSPEVNAGECGQADVAGGFGLVDRELQGGGAGLVVAGLALRSSETGDLVRLGLPKAEALRGLGGTTDVEDGVVEPMLDAGELAEHRVAANVEPRVVDRWRASARPRSRASTLRSSSPAEIAARAAKSQFAAWSHGRSSPS